MPGNREHMIDAAIRDHIVSWLGQVEREEGVRILFAAESGSRAWGFASPDSDYDVRFIYAHPRDWYTTLTEARDVIERPLDDKLVDLGGWDVRKALRLHLKSNPVLHEWFASLNNTQYPHVHFSFCEARQCQSDKNRNRNYYTVCKWCRGLFLPQVLL